MTPKNKAAVTVCIVLGLVGLVTFDLLTAPPKRPVQTLDLSSLPIMGAPAPQPEPPPEPTAPTKPSIKPPPSQPSPATKPIAAPPRKTYKVQASDTLWKIAAKFDSKNVSAMIDKIVKSNPDKLPNKETPLKAGWELAIP